MARRGCLVGNRTKGKNEREWKWRGLCGIVGFFGGRYLQKFLLSTCPIIPKYAQILSPAKHYYRFQSFSEKQKDQVFIFGSLVDHTVLGYKAGSVKQCVTWRNEYVVASVCVIPSPVLLPLYFPALLSTRNTHGGKTSSVNWTNMIYSFPYVMHLLAETQH
jgi:hypothetical protein